MIGRVEVADNEVANAGAETWPAESRWPRLRWVRAHDDFDEGSRTVRLLEAPAA